VQALEISGFEQGADFGDAKGSRGLLNGDARKALVAVEIPCFGQENAAW
jgi:hypothetical protein